MRTLLFTALLATTVAASAAEPLKPLSFRADARVDVDANGKFVKAEAAQDLPAPVRAYIEQQLATWQYKRKPDAQGVASTWVNLRACAVPNAQGEYAMGLAFNGSGPKVVSYGTPAQMVPVVGHRAETALQLHVVMNADGSATLESVDGARSPKRDLESALRSWVTTLRFEPERIDGKAIATTGVIPLEFQRGTRHAPKREELLAQALVSPQCKQAAQLAASEPPAPGMPQVAAESIVTVEPKI